MPRAPSWTGSCRRRRSTSRSPKATSRSSTALRRPRAIRPFRRSSSSAAICAIFLRRTRRTRSASPTCSAVRWLRPSCPGRRCSAKRCAADPGPRLFSAVRNRGPGLRFTRPGHVSLFVWTRAPAFRMVAPRDHPHARGRGGVPVSRSSAIAVPARSLLSSETALLVVLTLYIVILGLWPLARLFVEALLPGTSGEVLGLLLAQWQSAATQRALINTLESSLLATLLSVTIGTSVALALTLTDVRGKAALTFVAMLPLLVPSQITALAWIELTGAGSPILAPLGLAPAPGATNPLYSMGGIVLVMGIESSTLVFLAVRAGLRNVPRDLVEAARLGGANPLRVTAAVIMPLAMPAILAGAALAFVTSIGKSGIPAMLGIPGRYTVLTTLIYQRLQGFGPRVLGEVAALALILALLAVVGLILRVLIVRRGGFASDGAGAPLTPFRLGRGRVVVEL